MQDNFPINARHTRHRLQTRLVGKSLEIWEAEVLEYAKSVMVDGRNVGLVLFVAAVHPDNDEHTLLFIIDGSNFSSTGEIKPFVLNLARHLDVYTYGICAEAWHVARNEEDPAKYGSLANHPARQECVMLVTESKLHKRSKKIEISRDAANMPVFGDEHIDESQWQEGRLFDILYKSSVQYVN